MPYPNEIKWNKAQGFDGLNKEMKIRRCAMKKGYCQNHKMSGQYH